MRGVQAALKREKYATMIFNSFNYKLKQMKDGDCEHNVDDQTALLTMLGNVIGAASPQVEAKSYLPEELEPFKRIIKKCDNAWFKYIEYLVSNGFDETMRLSHLGLRQIVIQAIQSDGETIGRGFCRGAGWDYDEIIDSIENNDNQEVTFNI